MADALLRPSGQFVETLPDQMWITAEGKSRTHAAYGVWSSRRCPGASSARVCGSATVPPNVRAARFRGMLADVAPELDGGLLMPDAEAESCQRKHLSRVGFEPQQDALVLGKTFGVLCLLIARQR